MTQGSSGIAVRVDGLGKRYEIGSVSGRASLYEGLGHLFRMDQSSPRPQHPVIWALRNVTFDVHEGEIFGIVGRNGSGKSTLMKLLARISYPTEGRAEIHGRVGALLEVGTGFHPELNGRDNIALSGAILGMSRRDVASVQDRIVEFAEIGRFLDTPVKHYSSGMFLRLAFSVSAHMPAPIMLLDEVLAVGDTTFQLKCRDRIRQLVSEGRTVLIVSHDMISMRALCDRVVVLDGGAMRFVGSPEEATTFYTQEVLHLAADPVRVSEHVVTE